MLLGEVYGNISSIALYYTGFTEAEKLQKALEFGKKAVQTAPKFPGAHAAYAQALLQAKNYNIAVGEAKKAIALNPKLTFGYWILGKSYEALGKATEAIEAQKNTLLYAKEDITLMADDVAGTEAKARFALVILYAREKNRAQTQEYIEKMIIARDDTYLFLFQTQLRLKDYGMFRAFKGNAEFEKFITESNIK